LQYTFKYCQKQTATINTANRSTTHHYFEEAGFHCLCCLALGNNAKNQKTHKHQGYAALHLHHAIIACAVGIIRVAP